MNKYFQLNILKELSYSSGKIKEIKSGFFKYSIGTKGGTSGSPIMLFNNMNVIGLHKGCIYDENKKKINLGIDILIHLIYFLFFNFCWICSYNVIF